MAAINITRADFHTASGTTRSNQATVQRQRLIPDNPLVEADLANAALTGCRIYGVSAWGLNLDGAKQQDLVIAPPGEPDITADGLEVAQFIHLLLYNQAIRAVIDTIICKAVLILGRFPAGRRKALDALRDELRNRGCLPITFDFAGPATRNRSETI